MVGRYWLPSSYYRKQSQLMGVFMEIKRPKMFVFSWHSAKSVVNVWLGSEVRSHDLGNTGIGGGAETGSCDISAIRSWQPTFNVRSKYPYGYWCMWKLSDPYILVGSWRLVSPGCLRHGRARRRNAQLLQTALSRLGAGNRRQQPSSRRSSIFHRYFLWGL